MLPVKDLLAVQELNMGLGICALAVCLFGAEPESGPDELTPTMRLQWRRVFDETAATYKLARESETEPLVLVDRATYTWTRSGPQGGTYGSVYVWTHRGNAEAVACFWRYPAAGGKWSIVHELHSLSPAVLTADKQTSCSWFPKAGLKRIPLKDTSVPAATAAARLQQMRTICRDFSANSLGSAGDRTELRLLPQPLYRYQSTDPEVVDGALFAFVCSIGTDPEAYLQLEALKTVDGPQWFCTLARFSHMDLTVNYRDEKIWEALRDAENPISHNADRTYWVFHQPFDSKRLDQVSDK